MNNNRNGCSFSSPNADKWPKHNRLKILIRYEIRELKSKSTKFIKKSLLNLTVTVDRMKNGVKIIFMPILIR